MILVSMYVCIYPQALPVKKIKTTEATDGEAVSKGKGKENKTNWDGIKLGQTKDWRYTFQLCYQLILVTCTSSWNVNGIRAWTKVSFPLSSIITIINQPHFIHCVQNGGLEYNAREDPDIFCVQETKCIEKELPMVGSTTVHTQSPPPPTHTPPPHTHSHITPPHTHTHTEPARYSWLPRLLALRREEATAVWGEAYSPTVVWLVTSIVQAVLQREANFSDQWFGN